MSFIKVVSIVLVPLAVLGVSECVTGEHYFLFLKKYRPWGGGGGSVQGRWGFGRANGPFSHSIMFGSFFVMSMPLIWCLRTCRDRWRTFVFPLLIVAALGALSSMSSGPWMMMAVVIVCLMMERFSHLTKPLIWTIIGLCWGVGLVSNRPFYHVLLHRLNPVGGVWWQRAKLIDCAIEHFNEWWLLGYGMADPGWGPQMGMGHTDVNNEFILAGINYGIWGVLALCAMIITAFHYLKLAYKQTCERELKSVYWALGSVLTSILVLWQSVSFFGQPVMLFYCILGLIGSSVGFVQYASLENGRRYKVPPGRRLLMVSSSG